MQAAARSSRDAVINVFMFVTLQSSWFFLVWVFLEYFFTQFHYKWNFGFCFKTYINWLNVLLTMLMFLSWSIFFPLRSCKGKCCFWGTPCYIDGRKHWGQEVPTWPGLAVRSVSAHGQCPSWAVSPCWTVPHAWSLGTSSAAMFLLKMSSVWCAWWEDSKPHSHDLLRRRCRSCPLGRPESVPCKSCQPSSLGKDFEYLTSVPTGGLGTQCYGTLALSEDQSTSELEGPWETP